jgi:hypothetical protein
MRMFFYKRNGQYLHITALTIYRVIDSIALGNFSCPAALNNRDGNAEAGFSSASYDIRWARLLVSTCFSIYNVTVP